MASKTLLLLLLLPILVLSLSSLSAAHNITQILANKPDFSTFNDYLTQTNLANVINRRTTITVFAIRNSAIGGLAGLDLDTLKRLLAVHVALDYYDSMKLAKLKGSVILTTLLQASGIAEERKGFVNMTKFPAEHRISLRSAMRGAPFSADIVGPVMSNPFNISVLEVNGVIMTKDIDNLNFTVAPRASPAPKEAKAPSPAPSPAADAPAPVADAPEVADAPAPVADAPGPVADAPAPESDAPEASAPVANEPSPSDEESESDSAAGRVAAVGVGLGVAVVTVLMGL